MLNLFIETEEIDNNLLEQFQYLKVEDLKKPNIENIPKLLGEKYNCKNSDTYLLYLNFNYDKMDEEEKEYYKNIIKELKESENKEIENFKNILLEN